MINSIPVIEDLQIINISVMSGIRPLGRMTDHNGGRKNSAILYIWQGEASFFCEGETTVIAKDGDMVFIPKGKRYFMRYTAESTVFVLINFDLYNGNGVRITLTDQITVLCEAEKKGPIAKTVTALELCAASRTAEGFLRKKELMYRLFSLIYQRIPYGTEDSEFLQIAESVQLLRQSYLENLPITQIARASHVSVNYFRSLFRKYFAMSPVKYRNALRMERAKELLCGGNFTVSEVAYACGFENVGYFCRYYRQFVGESPSQTQKRMRSADRKK